MENTPPPSQPATAQAAAWPAYGDRYGNTAPPPSSNNSLHSVRRPLTKPWKQPTSLPIRPRVYRVEPRGFRQLVQRLTGAPGLAPRRLRDAAPPVALDLAPRQFPPPPQPLQQPAKPPLPAHLPGGSSLPPSTSTPPHAPGLSSGKAAVGAPPQTDPDVGYQSQDYAAGMPSPSLYSACLTWCNLPLLSPASMASLEQSTVL